jgi:hypothetical protein
LWQVAHLPATLDAWLKDLTDFDNTRALNGLDETGAKVDKKDLPYKAFGTNTATSLDELYDLIWRGVSLGKHRTELQAKLSDKWEPKDEKGGKKKKGRSVKSVANAGEIG